MVDTKGNHLRYTAKQRREESVSVRNREILEREKFIEGIGKTECSLSECNSRSVNYDKFKKYLKEKAEVNRKVKDFYQRHMAQDEI
jgi:ribosomal protein S16